MLVAYHATVQQAVSIPVTRFDRSAKYDTCMYTELANMRLDEIPDLNSFKNYVSGYTKEFFPNTSPVIGAHLQAPNRGGCIKTN